MKRKFFSVLLALVLVLSFSLVTAVPVGAQSNYPQFLDVVAQNVDGEWVTTVEATMPQVGTYSYHVFVADGSIGGLQIIHKYIYGPSGVVGTMKLTDLSTMTFWEYVKAAGGTMQMGAGIILYMDMDADGVWVWENDAQIILESPYPDSPLVTENLDVWMPRDIDDFAGFQKGAGSLNPDYTGVDGVALHCTLAEWQASGYATLPVLWVGIVSGWGDYSGYDGYFDDFIINGDTYDLEPRVINTDTAEGFNTIQAAIDDEDTVSGHTISVAAGTYEEDLIISTANLTLESVADAATTTILSAGSPNDIVLVTAADVTIDGFTIQGLSDTSGIVNGIDVRNSGFTIQNNIFAAIYGDNIYLGDAGVAITSGLIDLNTLTGMGTGAKPYRPAINVESGANAISGVTVSNNTISAYGGTESAGIQVAETTGAVSGIIVSDNEISDSSFGIATWNDGAATFTGNTITGCDVGVDIYGDVNPIAPAFTLSENTITTSTSYGIRMRGGAAFTGAGILIRYNNITGNGDGILVDFTGTVNSPPVATNNWWGNASGPIDAAVAPTSYGDTVSTNVNYQPWLLEVVDIEDPDPTTYDKTLALKDGFTLVSSDKDVITGTTWVGTNDLSPEDPETVITVMGYGYTLEGGVLVFGGASATDLEPVSALYVKTDGGGGVGINYSTGAPGVSEKMLLTGWNLISSATTDTQLLANAILSPLAVVAIGEDMGPGLATFASQGGYNQYTVSHFLPTLTETAWAALNFPLCPFDGYWIYMNAGKSFGVIPD